MVRVTILTLSIAGCFAVLGCGETDTRAAGDNPLQDAREARGYEAEPPAPAPAPEQPTEDGRDVVGSPNPPKIPTN